MKKKIIFILFLFICFFPINIAVAKNDAYPSYVHYYIHDRIKNNWRCSVPFDGPMIEAKIRINRLGYIESIQITESAGPEADNEVIKTIKKLSPFQPFPSSVDLKTADLVFYFFQNDMP